MFKQKRGLSEVIVTSLIIILGIAAVLIVWGFVSIMKVEWPKGKT